MRLGVFGGTFNPVHYGHLRAAEEARGKLSLDRVLFIPTGTPPLKSKGLASPDDRYAMTELAVSLNERFEILDIEFKRSSRSYSIDTIIELGHMYPNSELFFITGIDTFTELPKWKEPERLINLIDFVITSRPGRKFSELSSSPYIDCGIDMLSGLDEGISGQSTVPLKGGKTATLLSLTPIGISASDIRGLVKKGESIKYLLPESVESYIMSHGIYAG